MSYEDVVSFVLAGYRRAERTGNSDGTVFAGTKGRCSVFDMLALQLLSQLQFEVGVRSAFRLSFSSRLALVGFDTGGGSDPVRNRVTRLVDALLVY
jgi:hypothetical protein